VYYVVVTTPYLTVLFLAMKGKELGNCEIVEMVSSTSSINLFTAFIP
jgi:hypothetical protein